MSTFMQGVESSQICPPGYVHRAPVAVTGVNTVTVGTASEESVVRDSTNEFDIKWTGAITGTMATDLDFFIELSNVHYNIFVIGDTDGVNVPKILYSLSATAPVMPSGHDVFRRMGSVRNDASSDFLEYTEFGSDRSRRIVYKELRSVLSVLTNGSATTFANVLMFTLVPPTVTEVRMLCNAVFDDDEAFVEFRTDGVTLADPPIKLQGGTDTTSQLAAASLDFMIECDGSGRIEYENDSSGNEIDLYVLGYVNSL